MEPLLLEALAVGPIQANCYILGCPKTRQALLIDPGEEPDTLASRLIRQDLRPVAYFHTHGHLDHVGATAALKARFGGEILLHRDDLHLYEHAHEHAREFGYEFPAPSPVDRFVDEGDEIVWGEARGAVLFTPGHSPGGICLLVSGARMPQPKRRGRAAGGGGTSAAAGPGGDAATAGAEAPPDGGSRAPADWVFTGDALFQGSVGRTDLPGGSFDLLLRSIREKLLALPDDTIVASGHGPLSTIGWERRHNPFLQD